VQDFLRFAFSHADLDWMQYVQFDERYLRPTEVDSLIGNASKAKRILEWAPTIDLQQLASIMVDADILALACGGKPWIDKPALPGWQ
jgi:GDPmannose 4,6-dehydratase